MRFRKKPVVIEAEQFLPGVGSQHGDTVELVGHTFVIRIDGTGPYLLVRTLGGVVSAGYGYWVLNEQGALSVCKPEIFAQTYEPADADPLGP